MMTTATKKQCRSIGTAVIWPSGLEAMLDISTETRLRYEKRGMLPPRNVFIGGRAIGWKPSTIEAALAGNLTAAAA
jgi:predicted DNA-binding transcriptional regulator AlpA